MSEEYGSPWVMKGLMRFYKSKIPIMDLVQKTAWRTQS